MEGLPLLPGYSFNDISRLKHQVSHHFDWKNGYPLVRNPQSGIGGLPLDVQSVLYVRDSDPVRYDPSLTYGRTKTYVPKVFKPHFVLFDKKCLTFHGYFKQDVYYSPDEEYRIRHVDLIYFLEDDTITIMEPAVENAGFPQGRLVTRAKIPKTSDGRYYHWKDLNVGIDIHIYGVQYHLCSCDEYTREYLMSQGVEVNRDEELPPDPYISIRTRKYARIPSTTPSIVDKLFKFLAFDKQVLRFFAVWDDRENMFGAMNKYKIHYFLGDDKIEVVEILEENCGKDPYAVLLNKRRVPKNWKNISSDFPAVLFEKRDEDYEEFYEPKDLIVGSTIFIFGRRFLLCDCDEFTRQFYRTNFQIEQPAKIEIKEEKRTIPPQPLPPYTGFGTVEDSYQSCRSFIPQPPKKDLIRYLLNMSKVLRYTAVMDYIHPEDKERQFIIEYRLSDGNIAIHELKIQNAGFDAGKFLTHTLIPKPGTDPDNPEYYTPTDFTLGTVLIVFGHRFRITGADLSVYRYMEANPEKFNPEMIADVRKYLVREGHLTEDIKDVADFRKREEIAEPMLADDPKLHPITARDLMLKRETTC